MSKMFNNTSYLKGQDGSNIHETKAEPVVTQHSISQFLSSIFSAEGNALHVHDFVLNNIRYETLHKFTNSLPKSRFHNSGTEGFERSEILVSTKCDLATFIRAVSPLLQITPGTPPDARAFKPSLHAFREPSRATSTLSIDFGDLDPILIWLRMYDAADRMNIKRKCTSRSKVAMLRVLGTSCVLQTPTGKEAPSVRVDCFIPFRSNTAVQASMLQSVVTGVSSGTNECCFTLQWSACKPLSSAVWSSDATYTGMQVVGDMTIFSSCHLHWKLNSR